MLPLSQPILGLDGTPIREITVPKGTPIAVGIFSSNRNKALWGEDAGEWKPERWLSEGGLPEGIAGAQIPGVYSNLCVSVVTFDMACAYLYVPRMTFSGGGRSCM